MYNNHSTHRNKNKMHLTQIFLGGPGLASTKMSSFRILFELRMMEVVMTTGAIRCVKLQSNRN